MFFIGRTDTRTTQNYSSEPHKKTTVIVNRKLKRKKMHHGGFVKEITTLSSFEKSLIL